MAYAMHGSGPALLVPAWWVSQLELDWQDEAYQQFFETLGQHFTVIRYDRLGTGLSDRERTAFTLQSEYEILVELIEHLELAELSLLGISCGGPAALMYAYHFPNRVHRLVFVGSFINGDDLASQQMQEALNSLVLAHWGLGAKAILDLFDPSMQAQARLAISDVHRRSASAEVAKKLLELTFHMDVRALAKTLLISTLVLHREKDHTVPIAAGRRLAAAIPNAEFKSITGVAHLPWVGDGCLDFLTEIIQFAADEKATLQPVQVEAEQFRKLGTVWVLSYRGKQAHIKDALGVRDIHRLMSEPMREISSHYLYTGEEKEHNFAQSAVLDGEAIAQYRQRLQEIEQEKPEAAACDDEVLYAQLEEEQDKLVDNLSAALGLSGRARAFDDEAEKIRKAVSSRIRTSIKRISDLLPELGLHLKENVKTGRACCYRNSDSVSWLL